jgi:hypothetical protein
VHPTPRTLLAILAVLVIAPRVVRGQDRPFVFSLTTATDTAKPSVLVDYDVAFGEQAFRSSESNGPEQRIGVQASVKRWTFLGRLGVTSSEDTFQTSQQGEVLFSVLTPSTASTGRWRSPSAAACCTKRPALMYSWRALSPVVTSSSPVCTETCCSRCRNRRPSATRWT